MCKELKKISSGKVRDIYEVGNENLVIVTTDRISAFDCILDSMIPDKGKFLNAISNFWFNYTEEMIQNHLLSTRLSDMPSYFSNNADAFDKRTVLVKKLDMLPYEIIVRGYMFGSMWDSYKNNVNFCGEKFTKEYQLADKLEVPIITPSIKNANGHDEYISKEQMVSSLGKERVEEIFEISSLLYKKCYDYAYENGIIIADTKFEFGLDKEGQLVLGDEIFTPDSSRFWDLEKYKPGVSPDSFDKQFVRDWLIKNKLDGVEPAPKLPEDIVNKTATLYKVCCDKLVKE